MSRRVRKKANLVSVAEPQLVTLTKTPANRSGFKIMRSDEDLSAEETRRSDDHYLIRIDLPEGITREEALGYSSVYGMDEDYTLSEIDGRFCLVRNDAEEVTNPVTMALAGGQTAYIAPEAFQRSEDFGLDAVDCKDGKSNGNQAICLAALRFDRSVFTVAQEVDVWLSQHGVDYPSGGVEQSEDAFAVTRAQADEDICEVALAEGVTGIVCRAETTDYPYALYGKTVEQAYGSWGWQQLDFTAMLADVAFSEQSEWGIRRLRDVLDKIVLESELPLETRKQLIVNALGSYAAYQIGLIDALPRAVMDQTRSDEQPPRQERTMSDEAKTAAESQGVDTQVERSEAQAEIPVESADAVEAVEPEAAPEYVTRGELEEIVAAAVAKAIQPAAEQATEEAARSEEAVEESAPADDKFDKLMGAVTNMANAIKEQAGELKALRSDFEEAEGMSTVTRQSAQVESTATKRSDLTPDSPEFWSNAFALK